jgi:hypothetical protein
MKQIIVLLTIICASILAGILPSKKYILILFEYTGYYFVFVAFFLWVAYLFIFYLSKLKSLFLNHYDGLLFSAILIIFIFCIAPPKFKVLSDETNLIGISMAMYQSKKASLPLRGLTLIFKNQNITARSTKDQFYTRSWSLLYTLCEDIRPITDLLSISFAGSWSCLLFIYLLMNFFRAYMHLYLF